MRSRRYGLHGLVIESELELDAEPSREAVDLSARIGDPADQTRPLRGRPLAEWALAGHSFESVIAPDATLLLRYAGFVDFELSRSRGEIVIRPASADADEGMLATLLASDVLAHLLSTQGVLVLHASAVEIQGRAYAISCGSGGGKSTTAALLCAADARLMSDDAVAIDLGLTPPRVHRGTTGLRLRRDADEVAPDTAAGETTWDGRARWRPDPGPERAGLAGIVVPQPARDIHRPELEQLPDAEAWQATLFNPRARGVTDPAILRAHFSASAELARRVPVLIARIPWGPPFSLEAGAELAESLAALDERPTGRQYERGGGLADMR